MDKEEIHNIIFSGQSSYTFDEPEFSQLKKAMDKAMIEDRLAGVARFWPIINEVKAKRATPVKKNLLDRLSEVLIRNVGNTRCCPNCGCAFVPKCPLQDETLAIHRELFK